jgi:hypothetical protein
MNSAHAATAGTTSQQRSTLPATGRGTVSNSLGPTRCARQAVDPRRRRTAPHPAPRDSRSLPAPAGIVEEEEHMMFGRPAAMKVTPYLSRSDPPPQNQPRRHRPAYPDRDHVISGCIAGGAESPRRPGAPALPPASPPGQSRGRYGSAPARSARPGADPEFRHLGGTLAPVRPDRPRGNMDESFSCEQFCDEDTGSGVPGSAAQRCGGASARASHRGRN